jgi:DNA invertase Pin-like site-specific DNA recombinase
MKLVAYLRVSTDAQTEGLGLDVQKAAIIEWAEAHGHEIAASFTDAGVSGSNGLETRTGLADAFAALRNGDAVGLVVYRLDRLARDLIIQEQLLAEARQQGWAVFSTSTGEAAYLEDDPGDPSRKMIRQVLGAVAEYERSMIALRLRSGRARKAEAGGFAYGAPPYGYEAVDGELAPVADEQTTLTRIRRLHYDGKSFRIIAEALNAEGVKPRRGRAWHPGVLVRLIDRPNGASDEGARLIPATTTTATPTPTNTTTTSADRAIGAEATRGRCST